MWCGFLVFQAAKRAQQQLQEVLIAAGGLVISSDLVGLWKIESEVHGIVDLMGC